jgi:hypothetical protein
MDTQRPPVAVSGTKGFLMAGIAAQAQVWRCSFRWTDLCFAYQVVAPAIPHQHVIAFTQSLATAACTGAAAEQGGLGGCCSGQEAAHAGDGHSASCSRGCRPSGGATIILRVKNMTSDPESCGQQQGRASCTPYSVRVCNLHLFL